KPFDVEEVEARILAVFRRSTSTKSPLSSNGVLRSGDILIDPATRIAQRGEMPLKLTRLQFGFLSTLAAYPGEVVPYARLSNEVWGHDFVEIDAVHVLVHHLRRRLGDSHERSLIEAVPGIGYKLSNSRSS